MGQFFTKLVGVTSFGPEGTDRQRVIAKYCRKGLSLTLTPEPDNKFDENAIGAWIKVRRFFSTKSYHIGYISSDIAYRLSSEIQGGKDVEAKIKDVTGGGSKAYGVNIEIKA